MERWLTIVAAVNEEEVLRKNLMRSPIVVTGQAALIVERGHESAGKAYNAGLTRALTPCVAFVHQDVYLPAGWDLRLMRAVRQLNETDVKWAVLGPFGITAGGEYVGRVWSSGLGAVVGKSLETPEPVVSFDELTLVVRRSSGLRFDANLPAYHLYGTDIVQSALAALRTAYAFDGPVIHNSVPVRRLDRSYRMAYDYMRTKWANKLPIPTCVTPVTRWGWPLKKRRIRALLKLHIKPARFGSRLPSPEALARKLGFECPILDNNNLTNSDEWSAPVS